MFLTKDQLSTFKKKNRKIFVSKVLELQVMPKIIYTAKDSNHNGDRYANYARCIPYSQQFLQQPYETSIIWLCKWEN